MLDVFPQLAHVRIDYQWGGMIGIGANRLPQIGRLKAFNILRITGSFLFQQSL